MPFLPGCHCPFHRSYRRPIVASAVTGVARCSVWSSLFLASATRLDILLQHFLTFNRRRSSALHPVFQQLVPTAGSLLLHPVCPGGSQVRTPDGFCGRWWSRTTAAPRRPASSQHLSSRSTFLCRRALRLSARSFLRLLPRDSIAASCHRARRISGGRFLINPDDSLQFPLLDHPVNLMLWICPPRAFLVTVWPYH